MSAITLTPDQDNAIKAIAQFLANDAEPAFVLEGYSGTGKSTLIKHLVERMPKLVKTVKLINPKSPEYELNFTATTNKAAQNFSQITGEPVSTIHSFLGLTVQTDYRTQETRLVKRSNKEHEGVLLFVDEASYIDSKLLTHIFKGVRNSKVIFIGDPAQLTPVRSSGTPVFAAPFPKAKLEKVVRQAEGNPIVELSTKFRETVSSGQFFSFTPDGHHIQYLDRDAFRGKIEEEFLRPNWKFSDSKILAWRNATCVGYNAHINNLKKGTAAFQAGDYAICNNYFQQNKQSIKTEELVLITSISDSTEIEGVKGRYYTIENRIHAFCPDRLEDAKARVKQALKAGDTHIVENIQTNWIDLRSVYACTINKSQGSTYDRVFIDLDDLRSCNNGEQIARMLYVAVSRARHNVYFTGDLV